MPNKIKQNNPGRPNMRAVAEEAQLSPTTVSLGLRNDPSIPLETRERIQAAADKLHYFYSPRNSRILRRTSSAK